MFTHPIELLREEPLKALVSMLGVVAIVVLLWAVGAVAQGQVQRAQARDANMQQQATALRCQRTDGNERSVCGSAAEGSLAVGSAAPLAFAYR